AVISGNGVASYNSSNHPFKEYLLKIKEVTIEEGVTELSDIFDMAYSSLKLHSFSNPLEKQPLLNKVNLPNSLKKIGNSTFYACTQLEDIDLKNVEELGSSAFGYTRLKSITIPSSMKKIGVGALPYYYLEEIKVEEGNEFFETLGNGNFLVEKNGMKLIISANHDGEIPEGIKEIDANALYGRKITKLTIPSTIESIDASTWSIGFNSDMTISVSPENPVYDSRNDCNAVIETATNKLVLGCSKTKIPSGIKIIGEHAFSGADIIKSVVIPDGTEEIGEYAFYYCDDLRRMTLPSSIIKIDHNAFYDCKGFNIYYKGTKEQWEKIDYIHYYGAVYDKDGNLIYGEENGETTFPDGYNVEPYGDDGKYKLTVDNVESISDDGISKVLEIACSKYKDDIIEDLNYVEIGNNVKTIEDCFYDFDYIETLTIGKGIKVIEEGAFDKDSLSINNIYYNGSQRSWKKISIGEDNDALFEAKIHFTNSTSDNDNNYEKIATPELRRVTSTSISIKTKAGLKYSIDDEETWQTGGIFKNLEPDTTYSIVARMSSDSTNIGNVSDELVVTTLEQKNKNIFSGRVEGIGSVETGIKYEETSDSNGYAMNDVNIPMELVKDLFEKLTDAEKQKISNGDTLKVTLSVNDITDTASDADEVEKKVKGLIGDNAEIGILLDISLFLQAGDDDGMEIHETGGKSLSFKLKIPDELKNTDSSKKRTFILVHIHDGEAVKSAETSGDEFEVEENGFSTFAISYIDENLSDSEDSDSSDDKNSSETTDSYEKSASDNQPMNYASETRGEFKVSYYHTIPFAGKSKLKLSNFGDIKVTSGSTSYVVSKAKINKKKHSIQIKGLNGADKETIKKIKAATKGSLGLPFTVNPYYVSNKDSVETKTKKDGSLKSVKITIGGKKYKAKKTEWSYNSDTKTITFSGSNLAGNYKQ
nr:leucine-rich repeat domain-containing protein [Lachnospiraceae bacterium]